jgi:nitrogen regulatory protein PII
MRMVMVVFRNSLESEVLEVLAAHGVRAYTDLPRVVGIGESGARLNTFESPGFNSLILTAAADEDADRLVDGLLRFRAESAVRQHGAAIPLRVFVLPCLQAV